MRKVNHLVMLAAIVVARASVEAQLPAQFERMQDPNLAYQIDTDVSEDTYNLHLQDPNLRIVDLEIDKFKPGVALNDYRISMLRVENQGDYAANWTFALDWSESTVWNMTIPAGMRIADIELNYHDHYAAHPPEDQARYGVVLVENTGNQFANWTWMPAEPEISFWINLQSNINAGWRPYDIEFKQWNGTVYGTALLAYNSEGASGGPVETGVFHFNANDLSLTTLEWAGWQLMDVEKAVGDLGVEWEFVGIFVKTGLTHSLTPSIDTYILSPAGNRIIDLERQGRMTREIPIGDPTSDKKGDVIWYDHVFPTYTTVRLKP